MHKLLIFSAELKLQYIRIGHLLNTYSKQSRISEWFNETGKARASRLASQQNSYFFTFCW